MAYYITNDKNYLMRNVIGQFVSTNEQSQAYIFSSKEKAENAVKNLPKPFKNLGYHVTCNIEVFEPKPGNYYRVLNDIPLEDSLPSYQKIISIVKEFENTFKRCVTKEEELNQKLNTIDRAIMDVEHSIEFFNYNACEGYKMYKKMKDLRTERRKIKDSLLIINFLKDFVTSEEINWNPSERIEGLLTRGYEPRELKELFENRGDKHE